MSWPTDEARTQLIRSLLIYKELYGEDAAINFLEQELVREHVCKERRAAAKQALLAPPAAAASRELAVAIDALKFYAEETNYERRGRGASLIAQDGGSRAREALATIAGDEESE